MAPGKKSEGAPFAFLSADTLALEQFFLQGLIQARGIKSIGLELIKGLALNHDGSKHSLSAIL